MSSFFAETIIIGISDVSRIFLQIVIDEEKIKRVVANIVGNAVKYIQREQGMILVNVEDQGPFIQVMIRDNGKGIGKEELPFIFERFYRTDSSRNSRTGGSGLGLAIAKKIMDEHGGRIWAESELGKGTEVYFTLKKETEQNHSIPNNPFPILQLVIRPLQSKFSYSSCSSFCSVSFFM